MKDTIRLLTPLATFFQNYNLLYTMSVAGILPSNCPPGTKFHILNLGTLQADEGFLVRGGNTSSLSEPNPVNMRRDLMAIAVLIDHPYAGLLLFETGCAEDIDLV